jgi:hypothetical protein
MFSSLICFLTIVNVSDVPRGRVQVLFRHQKQQSPPLGSSLPRELKCLVSSRSTLKATTKCFTVCKDPLVFFFLERIPRKNIKFITETIGRKTLKLKG